MPSIEDTSTNPAFWVQIHVIPLARKFEVEVKRCVSLVAHPVGWAVVLERNAGMDQVPW